MPDDKGVNVEGGRSIGRGTTLRCRDEAPRTLYTPELRLFSLHENEQVREEGEKEVK